MIQNTMRKFILLFVALLGSWIMQAGPVEFMFSNSGKPAPALAEKMESAVSALLTEVNAAQREQRALNLANMHLDNYVVKSMNMLWDNCPFECIEDEIIERCLVTGTGYEIRNIPLMMRPLSEEDFNEDDYHEAVINFNKNGEIESFYLSISNVMYKQILNSTTGGTVDFQRRQLILDWVERFRTAYEQKDLEFMEQVFSDDALIITGKVIKKAEKSEIQMPKIEYKKQDKKGYLNGLRKVFANNKRIRVTFDDIEIKMHSTESDVYGVTLHQGYRSDYYGDDGYVFLLWDFMDESAPKIHVRTWQPDKFGDGTPVPKNELFDLDDFDI